MTVKVKVEVYSRVSGYYRPMNQWNKGKKEEFKERKNLTFVEDKNEIKIPTEVI